MTSDKLRECPFCGGEAEIVDATKILGAWRIVHRCEWMGFLSLEGFNIDMVINRWNTRAADEKVKAVVAAMKKARDEVCSCNGTMGRCLIHECYDHCIELAQLEGGE